MLKPFLLVAVVLVAASCTSATSPDAVASSSTSTTNVALTSLPPATTSTTTTTTTTTVPVPLELAAEPRPPRAAPEPAVVDGFSGEGAVTIAKGGAALYETPDAAEPFVVAREGLVFAAHSQDDEWIEVFTSCDAPAWLHSSEVLAEPAVAPATIGAGFDFSQAVIVLDPGHGGPWNTGAVSPSGLIEKEINLDIARRVGDLLREPHGVDWDTGQIFVGNEVSEAAWVMMTRAGDAVSADYEAGLVFRSDLANSIGANAMVAIHNNAGWEVRLDGPGSDVYYQSQLAESRRFAKIMVAELRRSFRSFEADWVGSVETGAKSRLSAKDDNPQYYGILRRSEMPTVITEGAYMSNQTEADLLATPEFRQAYADAIYRALVRFLTTDDTSDAPDSDPVIWAGTTGSGDARPDCVIPSQN